MNDKNIDSQSETWHFKESKHLKVVQNCSKQLQ